MSIAIPQVAVKLTTFRAAVRASCKPIVLPGCAGNQAYADTFTKNQPDVADTDRAPYANLFRVVNDHDIVPKVHTCGSIAIQGTCL